MLIKNVEFSYPFLGNPATRHTFDQEYVEITGDFYRECSRLEFTVTMITEEYIKLLGEGKLENRIKEMIIDEIK